MDLTDQTLINSSNYFGPRMCKLTTSSLNPKDRALTGGRLQKTLVWKPELSLQPLSQSCCLVRLDIDRPLALHTRLHWKGYGMGTPSRWPTWKTNPSETEFPIAHFRLVQLAWACHCRTWRPRRWPNHLIIATNKQTISINVSERFKALERKTLMQFYDYFD